MTDAKMEVQDCIPVWTVWTNTDLTEGRGHEIPLAVCECKATAIRLGKKRGVQGSDCRVTEGVAVKIEGQWLSHVFINSPTREDLKAQELADNREKVIAKAKAAGLTEEELKWLRVQQD